MFHMHRCLWQFGKLTLQLSSLLTCSFRTFIRPPIILPYRVDIMDEKKHIFVKFMIRGNKWNDTFPYGQLFYSILLCNAEHGWPQVQCKVRDHCRLNQPYLTNLIVIEHASTWNFELINSIIESNADSAMSETCENWHEQLPR